MCGLLARCFVSKWAIEPHGRAFGRKLLNRVLLVREYGGLRMGIAANQQEDVLPQKNIGKDLRTFPRNAGYAL